MSMKNEGMRIRNVKIHDKTETLDGFVLKEGFASFEYAGQKWVTSGMRDFESIYCYKYEKNIWVPQWIIDDPYENTEGILDLIQMLDEYDEKKEIEKALEYSRGKKLHESATVIEFTDVVAGRKCHNGGEYGFGTRYEPISSYPGLYRKVTFTTCDFDSCGTGDEGIVALTEIEYLELVAKEKQVLEDGNKYN